MNIFNLFKVKPEPKKSYSIKYESKGKTWDRSYENKTDLSGFNTAPPKVNNNEINNHNIICSGNFFANPINISGFYFATGKIYEKVDNN